LAFKGESDRPECFFANNAEGAEVMSKIVEGRLERNRYG
jgi:hypothetical protein